MNHYRTLLITFAAAGIFAAVSDPDLTAESLRPGSLSTKPSSTTELPLPAYLGVQSCSASACHGNLEPHQAPGDIRFNEFHVWTNDPHQRAYQTLFDDRSRRMFVRLGVQDSTGKILNRELFEAYWQQCLGCHAPSLSGQDLRHSRGQQLRGEGVGCEACHGPASEWVNLHYRRGWKDLSPQQKADFGFQDTSSVATRAAACASCHVGDENRNVNHDLIAAGHPAMKFEMTWYERRLPPHWNPARRLDRELPLEKWLAGQLAGAEFSLRQLERRATDARKDATNPASHGWPELAEYSCFSCHHELVGQRGGTGPRTTFPYRPWELILLPELAKRFPSPEASRFLNAFEELHQTMSASLGSAPDKIAPLAAKAVAELKSWQAVLHPDSSQIAQAVKTLSQLPESSWERDAQLFLALAAPYRTGNSSPPEELKQLRVLLAFPATPEVQYDSPRNYLGAYEHNAPESYEANSRILHDLLNKLSSASSSN